MRASARAVLLRQDVQDKRKRALQRWPRGDQVDFTPGDMVFFYPPKPKSSRFKKDGGAWRGPAIVLIRESEQRFLFFVSWKGRCLHVSPPNLRLSFGGNHDVGQEEAEKAERDQGHEGLSHVPPPPPQKEESTGGWEAQEAVIRPSKKGIPQHQAKEIAKSLKGMKTVTKTVKKRKKEKDSLEKKGTKTEAVEAVDEIMPLPTQLEEFWQQQFGRLEDEGYQQRLRKHLLDDMPMSIKRPAEMPLEEEQSRKKFKADFCNYTMVATSTSTTAHTPGMAGWIQFLKSSVVLPADLGEEIPCQQMAILAEETPCLRKAACKSCSRHSAICRFGCPYRTDGTPGASGPN